MIARRTARHARVPTKPTASPTSQTDPGPLTEEELAGFRELLLEKRRSLAADLGMIWSEDTGGESELLAREYDLLRQIDSALEQIDRGSYGVCEATGAPIGRARLQACPWARHCIEYARQNERIKTPTTAQRRWPGNDENLVPNESDSLDHDRVRLASG